MTSHPELRGSGAEGTAKMVYILYLVGIVFGPVGVVGLVVAYVNKGDAPAWLQTHYQFQIRTFWIGALYIFIGAVLSLAVVGYLLLLFWFIWLVVRCVKGIKCIDGHQPHPDPTGWLF